MRHAAAALLVAAACSAGGGDRPDALAPTTTPLGSSTLPTMADCESAAPHLVSTAPVERRGDRWDLGDGRTVELVDHPLDVTDSDFRDGVDMLVADQRAWRARIDGGWGFAVTPSGSACEYGIEAIGMGEPEAVAFVEGLWRDDREFAVWPTTSPEAAQGLSTGNADPAGTAVAYAQRVLGWQDAQVTGDPRDLGGGTSQVPVVAGGGREAEITVRRLLRGRWWGVLGVWTFGDADLPASVTLREDGTGDVRLAVDDVEYADAEIAVARGSVVRVARATSPVAASFEHLPLDAAGAISVLLEDDAGAVVGAWATAIPPGPFAAG